MADAVASTDLSHSAIKQQILRLKQVVLVSRQDFFLILGPEDLPMGTPAAVKWLDAFFK